MSEEYPVRHLERRALRVFHEEGLNAKVIGSTCIEKCDIFSDTDLWVEIPDSISARVIANRDRLFNNVGDLILKWERPRFAPLGGMHSILFYDNELLPIGMDVYMLPQTVAHERYRGFAVPEHNSHLFEWQSGDDSHDPAERIKYLLSVAYWCTKYVHRGDIQKIDWLYKRYIETREHIPDLPEIDPYSDGRSEEMSPFDYIQLVVEAIMTLNIPDASNAASKFINAPKIGKLASQVLA